MLWIPIAFMCILAVAFVVVPLVRDTDRPLAPPTAAGVLVVGLAVGLYGYLGSPQVPSGRGQPPDVAQMVTSLAARLAEQPDDLNGWKMLGRSYMTLGDFPAAVDAYEQAVGLESALNAQTLVDLAVAVAQADGQQLTPRAVSAFENALAIDPNHPEALFYGGIAAFNRGDELLAADRWERLLSTNPPPEVRAIIEERVAAWRGQPLPQRQVDAPTQPTAGAVVSATISVAENASQSLPRDATVFVIARDPAQPSPPIAVTRRPLSELPAVVTLGDRDSMIPGRTLSAFPEFELVARASATGEPAQRAGDWYGSKVVRPSEASAVELTIATEVR